MMRAGMIRSLGYKQTETKEKIQEKEVLGPGNGPDLQHSTGNR